MSEKIRTKQGRQKFILTLLSDANCYDIFNKPTLSDRINDKLKQIDAKLITERTITRDIKELRRILGSDEAITFNSGRNSFELKDEYRGVYTIELLDDEERKDLLLINNFAQQLLPKEFLELESYNVYNTNFSSGLKSADTFYRQVYGVNRLPKLQINLSELMKAWKEHKLLKIKYLDAKERESERSIEIHQFYLYENHWYAYAWCGFRKEARAFRLDRIQHCKLQNKAFIPRQELLSQENVYEAFNLDFIHDVSIRCTKKCIQKLGLSPLFPEESREQDGEDTLLIYDKVPEQQVISWILAQAGEAKAVGPKQLRLSILKHCEKILNA